MSIHIHFRLSPYKSNKVCYHGNLNTKAIKLKTQQILMLKSSIIMHDSGFIIGITHFFAKTDRTYTKKPSLKASFNLKPPFSSSL